MIERGAKRVDVATRIGALVLDLFQRRVMARIAEKSLRSSYGLVRGLSLGKTKIEQRDLTGFGHLLIVRVNMPVDHLAIALGQLDPCIERLVSPGELLFPVELT